MPSGDLHYLIKHGPSISDSPVSDILAGVYRVLPSGFLGEHLGKGAGSDEAAQTIACLESLAGVYASAGCYINLSPDTIFSMVDEDPAGLIRSYCSKSCSEVLNDWQENNCNSELITPKGRELLDQYRDDKRQRDTFCSLFGPAYHRRRCGPAIVNLNKIEWALNGRPRTPIFLTEIDKELGKLKARAGATDTIPAIDHNQKVLSTKKPKYASIHDPIRRLNLHTSVCSACIWNWLAETNMNETMNYMKGPSSASECVKFVEKYHSTCMSLGAYWHGGRPDANRAMRRVKENGRALRYIEIAGGTSKNLLCTLWMNQ